MKCPKCGSEARIRDGLILCAECGYARPEPTNAEMLLQLTKSVLGLSENIEAIAQKIDILCEIAKGIKQEEQNVKN